jgi:UDP-glucose 4-epimerase
MRVIATGGAGYVGSAAVRCLLAKGYDVFAYDSLIKGHRQSLPADRLIIGDLADKNHLVQVLQDLKIDAVMHFASFISVGESTERPLDYYHNNIVNSLALLEAMREANIKKIVFSSTAAVYAPITEGALQEDSPKNPDSPYAFSKFAVERLIEDFSRAYGLGYTILRYFNACGAGPDGRFGEDHDPETHLIPLVLQVPLGQRKKIGIFGRDYPTPDGTCIRDYIHVDDLADAHRRALDTMQAGKGNVYNIGTGTGHSVLEVIRAAEEVTGQKIACEYLPRRSGDTTRLVAGSEKLRKELGWSPAYKNLHAIIESAWRWHSNHPDGYGDN